MFGAAPPVSLPNLPPLPGLPADIFQQAQQQQDKALNLHLQRQRAMEEATREHAKEDRLKQTSLAGEESEDEDVDKDHDDHPGSIHNENSLSPPPPMQGLSTNPLLPHVAGAGAAVLLPSAAAPSSGKKRHRSHDSQEVEEVVSSPKKHHSHRPLGLPGANIKIENRGKSLSQFSRR